MITERDYSYVEYKFSKKGRGWPVTATGATKIHNLKQYQGWRKAHDLPEESPDFSDRDVFDLVFHLIEKARGALVRISEGEENVNL